MTDARRVGSSAPHAGSCARRPAVDGTQHHQRRAPVQYAARVVSRRGPWVFCDVEGVGTVAMLKDGRTCVDPVPWFSTPSRVAAARADFEAALAEVEYRGQTLAETRLVRFSEMVRCTPYDLDTAAASARSAAGW